MERTISFDDLKSVAVKAYDTYKQDREGKEDPRVAGRNTDKFGISIRLVDGRKFDVGDTQATYPLGAISKLPVVAQLLTQMPVTELVQRMGLEFEKCKCSCNPDAGVKKPKGVHAHSLRAISMVEPVGDSDGKMDILSNMLINMVGESPVFDDALYKEAMADSEKKDTVNTLAAAGYEIYDDTSISVNISNRLRSMLASSEQIATLGATIAADGVNPVTKQIAFDGANSQSILSIMAARGPKGYRRGWLMTTGVPAISSFGGGFLAIVPGFGAIAAFGPRLYDCGAPVAAAQAVKRILSDLQINALSSARVVVK
ncbi:MAG: glutaminase [Duncaniella sp.]|nr:glutaminase [Duncaniella sp.]